MLLTLLLLASAAPAVQDSAHLVIVATTDVHGRATGWDYVNDRPWGGGLVRAARPIDSLRAAYPDQVVLVDAGDLLQGDPFAAYFAQVAPRDPNPIVDVMNQLGYDVATPGNHDFNFGVGPLREMLRRASFRVVSANIITEPSGDPMFGRQTVLLVHRQVAAAVRLHRTVRTRQMRSAYSRMLRSLENLPMDSAFTAARRLHSSPSRNSASTRRWASS